MRRTTATRFGATSRADPDVIVPEVYREFTTRRVLTMEFIEGIKITRRRRARSDAGIDKHVVAQKLTEIFCAQILRDGFFHADPHPGNILVQPGPKLVLLDFGLAKDFPPAFRDGIVRLTFAILSNDKDAMVRAFTELGFRTRNGSPDTLVSLVRGVSRRRGEKRQGVRGQGADRAILRGAAARSSRKIRSSKFPATCCW